MAVIAFVSSFSPILKDNGTVNNGGVIEFFEPDTAFAIAKAVYSDVTLSTSLGAVVTLSAAGTKTIFLNGNYDIKIKDSALSLLRSVQDINPDTTSTANESNLIPNGSFEESSNNLPTDWTLFEWNASANVVDSTDQSHGKYSMKFVSTGTGGGYITTNAFFSVSPTQAVDVVFMLKSTADVRNTVQLLWYDKDQVALGGTPSTTVYDNSTTNPTSWQKMYGGALPPAGAYWAKLKIIGCDSSDGTAGTARFDGVNLSIPTSSEEGIAVASAATTDIWGAGYVKHVTGTTTITSFGTAPYAGATRLVLLDSAISLTHSSNLNLPGAVSLTLEADATLLVYADTTTQLDVFVISSSLDHAVDTQSFTSSGTWTKPAGYHAKSRVVIENWGGGASGGRYNAGTAGGGGGGGYARREVLLSDLGATETVTIGAGGAAVGSNTNGNAGGTTTFGSLLTAFGGGGGGSNNGGVGGRGGGGGSAVAVGPVGTTANAGVMSSAEAGAGGAEDLGASEQRPGGNSVYSGGGGGGGKNNGDAATTNKGGNSLYGGAGGGGASTTTPAGTGGTSSFGGNGGAGAFDANNATAGTQPGGGGGGAEGGSSGAGAAGKIVVTVYNR